MANSRICFRYCWYKLSLTDHPKLLSTDFYSLTKLIKIKKHVISQSFFIIIWFDLQKRSSQCQSIGKKKKNFNDVYHNCCSQDLKIVPKEIALLTDRLLCIRLLESRLCVCKPGNTIPPVKYGGGNIKNWGNIKNCQKELVYFIKVDGIIKEEH